MNALIVSTDPRRVAELAKTLGATDVVQSVQSYQGALNGHAVLPAKGEIDTLLLDCSDAPSNRLDEIERLAPLYPRLQCVIMLDDKSPELLLRALRLGVREVVPSQASPGELTGALQRIAQRATGSERPQGKVLAFISCKGGSGATFIATNLGYAIAESKKLKVLLIDLNLQFGDAALFISDRRAPTTLADIARDIGRLDLALIESAMIPVLPNYGVIAAPEDPALAADVRPAQVETLIRFARANFDYVLVDVGRSLDAVSVKALDVADYIFPVFQLTLPFIRDGKRLLGLFNSLNYSKEKIRPIVNRYARNNDLSVEDLERAISMRVFGTVPNHYEAVAASVNQGVPIQKLHRASPVAKSLAQLADSLVSQAPAPQSGWLGRLFSRSG